MLDVKLPAGVSVLVKLLQKALKSLGLPILGKGALND